MRYGTPWGAFEISSMPGSPQLGVSHGLFVVGSVRGRGYGKLQHEMVLARAREMRYDALVATVREDNAAEEKILQGAGWVKVFTFTSAARDTRVGLWVRALGVEVG